MIIKIDRHKSTHTKILISVSTLGLQKAPFESSWVQQSLTEALLLTKVFLWEQKGYNPKKKEIPFTVQMTAVCNDAKKLLSIELCFCFIAVVVFMLRDIKVPPKFMLNSCATPNAYKTRVWDKILIRLRVSFWSPRMIDQNSLAPSLSPRRGEIDLGGKSHP